MQDRYSVPTMALLGMMVAVFALLYWRSRTNRRLLWLIGWSMATVRLIFQTNFDGAQGLKLAISNVAIELAGLMFLGSVSPILFLRKPKLPYVAAFGTPLIFLAVLTSLFPHPGPLLHGVILLSVVVAAYVVIHWSAQKNLLPVWFTMLVAIAVSITCFWLVWTDKFDLALWAAHAGCSFITALLFIAAYRRFSPGVIFTATGLFLWSSPIAIEHVLPADNPVLHMYFHVLELGKVMAALGMVALALEDEIALNEAAQRRDRRARVELEQYAKLDLSAIASPDFEICYDHICQEIVQVSRFRQAAIFIRSVERNYYLAGKAGMEGALAGALEELGKRLTVEQIREFSKSDEIKVELGNTAFVNLRPLFVPGDELERLNFVQVHAIPIFTRSGDVEGSLVLSKIKDPSEPLQADDLLPLELLMARIAANRQNDYLLRRMMQSEKLAGLGHLAGGVAHELNNPLTVVMGYAELLEENDADERSRRNASVIRREARRMKQIIESLVRFSKPSPSEQSSVSIEQLLLDIERLRRTDLDRKGIDFRLKIAENLPRIRANGDQLRQVFLQVVNNAISALAELCAGEPRRLVVDATLMNGRLHVIVSDSGPGFPDPQHVFDPFYTTKQPGQGIGLGLSFCYSVIREHRGEIIASNLHPRGAAVVIELPTHMAMTEHSLMNETLVH